MKYLATAIVLILLWSCEEDLPAMPVEIPFTSVDSGGSSYSLGQSAIPIETPMLFVLRSQEEFDSFWVQHRSGTIPAPPPPEFDFTDVELVILLDLVRYNSGFFVKVHRVNQTGQVRRVFADQSTPGRGCIVFFPVIQPFEMLALPKSRASYALEIVVVVRECGRS